MTYLAVKQANRSILRSNNCNLSGRPKRAHARFVVVCSFVEFFFFRCERADCNKKALYVSICCFCRATKSESLKRLYSRRSNADASLLHLIVHYILQNVTKMLGQTEVCTTNQLEKIRVNIFNRGCIAGCDTCMKVNGTFEISKVLK